MNLRNNPKRFPTFASKRKKSTVVKTTYPTEIIYEVLKYIDDFETVRAFSIITELLPVVEDSTCVIRLHCSEYTGIKMKHKKIAHLTSNIFDVKCVAFRRRLLDVDYSWLADFESIHRAFDRYKFIKIEVHLYTDPDFRFETSQRAFFDLQKDILESGLFDINNLGNNVFHIEFINSYKWFWNSSTLCYDFNRLPDPTRAIDAHPNHKSIGFVLNYVVDGGETVKYNEDNREVVLATQPWTIDSIADRTYITSGKTFVPKSSPILSKEFASSATQPKNIIVDLHLINSTLIRPEIKITRKHLKKALKFVYKKVNSLFSKEKRNPDFDVQIDELDSKIRSDTLAKLQQRCGQHFAELNGDLMDDEEAMMNLNMTFRELRKKVHYMTTSFYENHQRANNPNLEMSTYNRFYGYPNWGTGINVDMSQKLFNIGKYQKADVKSYRIKLAGKFQINAIKREVEYLDYWFQAWYLELINHKFDPDNKDVEGMLAEYGIH